MIKFFVPNNGSLSRLQSELDSYIDLVVGRHILGDRGRKEMDQIKAINLYVRNSRMTNGLTGTDQCLMVCQTETCWKKVF